MALSDIKIFLLRPPMLREANRRDILGGCIFLNLGNHPLLSSRSDLELESLLHEPPFSVLLDTLLL
jgi:hypothetical protein